MNQGSNNLRKNENLHALYSILEYCEDPNICRRKMQLNFLGEKFEPSLCKRMCDNCRTGKVPVNKDYSKESKEILKLVMDLEENSKYATAL